MFRRFLIALNLCKKVSITLKPFYNQVRVEGKAEKITAEESSQYFQSRPKDSQLGAMVSLQSTVIPNREVSSRKTLTVNIDTLNLTVSCS